jgi:hypothetical protein
MRIMRGPRVDCENSFRFRAGGATGRLEIAKGNFTGIGFRFRIASATKAWSGLARGPAAPVAHVAERI